MTAAPAERFDLGIGVDADGADRLGAAEAAILACPLTIDIDHHTGADRYGALQLIDPTAAATGELIFDLIRELGVPLDRAGRVLVEKDLRVPGDERVFVAGDLAYLEIEPKKPVPGLAPAAIQAGAHTASNVISLLHGQKTRPFVYKDKGTLATIGRKRAIADIRGFKITGVLAWWAWLLIHILFLIGFRNRVLVLIEWAWAYLTYERGARLITGGGNPK